MTKQTEFTRFGLSEDMSEALSLLGYLTPTPIQEAAIPAILEGQDVVGKSQTGSGKTAAFAIPICERIIWDAFSPQALVLEPTRELAVQVQEEMFQIGRKKRLKMPVVFGGMPVEKQAISLKQRAHIVVGTPGRVLDHIRRDNLVLSEIRTLVIDEADLMLDMGFAEDVEQVIRDIRQAKEKQETLQIILFSATFGDHLDSLIQEHMQAPLMIRIDSEFETADGIDQSAYHSENEDKFDALMQLLITENPEKAMIFCDTREMTNTLYQKMKRKKIRCGMLHGGMEQRDRLYAISDFRRGLFHYFITTDVAARGIDFPDITHVINYDFPTKRENYVHRIGRTARNGRTGKAFSLISQEEEHYKKAVEEYTGKEIPYVELLVTTHHTAEQKLAFNKKQKEKLIPKEGKSAVFQNSIMKLTIGGGKKSKMRAGDIVGAICSIDGVTQEDIGVIDVRDSLTYVEIQNKKGQTVLAALQEKPIKGKLRKVRQAAK